MRPPSARRSGDRPIPPAPPRRAATDARLAMVLGMQLAAELVPEAERDGTAARMDALFARAREAAPHDALLAVEEARTLTVLDRPADAIARLEPMAARYPDQGIVLAELAYARLASGDREGALGALRRAVEGRWRRVETRARERAASALARLELRTSSERGTTRRGSPRSGPGVGPAVVVTASRRTGSARWRVTRGQSRERGAVYRGAPQRLTAIRGSYDHPLARFG